MESIAKQPLIIDAYQQANRFLEKFKDLLAHLKFAGVEFIAPPLGWDNGINSFNPNHKPDLTRIIEATRKIEEGGLSREAALQQVLETDFSKAIEELNIRGYERIDSIDINDASPESIRDNLNIGEISQQELAKSLSHLKPEERELAMQYIKQELRFVNPRAMDKMIDQVYGDLIKKAKAQGIDPNKIYFYVPAPKPSAKRNGTFTRHSPKIIANALAQKYNIPADRFIFPGFFEGTKQTRTQIRELRNNGDLKMLAYIDDFNGSGATTEQVHQQMRAAGKNIPIFLGSLVTGGSGQKATKSLQQADQSFTKQEHTSTIISTATTIAPLQDTAFYKNLSPYQQALFGKIVGEGGIFSNKEDGGYGLVFFYSSPNNDNKLISEHIAPLFGLGDQATRVDRTRR